MISRGYEVLPRGTVHPRQSTPNYELESAYEYAEHMDSEIARLLAAGYLQRYE